MTVTVTRLRTVQVIRYPYSERMTCTVRNNIYIYIYMCVFIYQVYIIYIYIYIYIYVKKCVHLFYSSSNADAGMMPG